MHIKPLITALLCAAAAGPTLAQDDGALMLAAKLNIGEKLAAECDTLKPGTLREYQAHLKTIEAALKGRLDVSATARQHTETIPEVASAGYVQKFRKKSPEAKQASCAATMASIRQDARDAAEMSAGKR